MNRQAFIDEVGVTPEEFMLEADASERRWSYLLAHWEEYERIFPGQHVAVVEADLVTQNADLDAVLAEIDAKRIPRGSVTVEYIRAETDPIPMPLNFVAE